MKVLKSRKGSGAEEQRTIRLVTVLRRNCRFTSLKEAAVPKRVKIEDDAEEVRLLWQISKIN